MVAIMSEFISKLVSVLAPQFSQPSPSLWKMILSVLAALFGVQSEENRERDFTKGSVWKFTLLGLITLTIFIIAVILLTRWALSLAGA